jgi:hypothetical protein
MRPTIEMPPFPNIGNGGFCEDTDPHFNWTMQAANDSRSMRLDSEGKDPCGNRSQVAEPFSRMWSLRAIAAGCVRSAP